MNDLIYRQQAIDAVKIGAFSARTIYGRTDEGSTALHETVRAIKALPPAQEIILCKDCIFYDYDMGECGHKYGLMVAHDNSFCSLAERRSE